MTICLRQDRSCKAPRRVLIIPMQGVGEYQILCSCTLIKTAVFFSPLPLLQYGILTCVSPNAPACTHCLGKLVSRGFSWFFISFSLFFHNEIRVDEHYNFSYCFIHDCLRARVSARIHYKKIVLESKESDVFCYRIPLSAA